MSGDLEEREVTISGVKVVFPCKPYPSQFGMMDRVIKGLERGQNCLLESPTGSGKSLALLCSALAWQNSLHLKYAKEAMSSSNMGTKDENMCQACCCKTESKGKEQKESGQESKTQFVNGPSQDSVVVLDGDENDDDDDDFKVQSKYRTSSLGQSKTKKRGHVSISYDDNSSGTPVAPQEKCTCSTGSPSTSSKQKVPKIYFGTRTHKQIAQIVRELRKTAYHDVRMAILASREYTCVHHEVVKLKNKSEGCRERLDVNGPGCSFNDRAKRVFLNQGQLQNELNSAWDLEELVHACKGRRACPYFVTRNIKDQADIIFCPYNYLIDPLVRKSMEINLKDQIVILDEAHNIEDCARDAASGQLTTEQITQTIHNLQELLDANVKFSDHLTLKRMMENVMKFVDDNSTQLDQADYDTSYKVWSGFDMVARLKSIGLGPDTLDEYKSCLDNVSASDEDQQQNTMRNFRNLEIKLHSSSIKILELLLQILDYMYRNDLKFVEDYRVAVMKSMQYVSTFNSNDSWLGKNRRGRSREVVFTLNFWCMNPAVAFSDFTPCRNVVLSSGTLSPMTSFASELGVPFPIQLEANHIIKEEQVWVGSIGSGPSGSQLQAVYKNMETFSFQDELGNFIVQVCQNVPHGVLCFLPSYRALDKFTERWKLTRVWEKLSAHKKVLVEPRAVDREDFDHMMKKFYEVVRDPSCSDDEDGGYMDTSDRNGALFLAVCRGKVSEGMDFADNNARAVITVGIPFPSIKDLQVKLKREYNDKYRTERGLLSGNEWYEIQAFRALNQALGRCIRHRKDWGAIIIVDDRFVRMAGKYCKGLSKWVRNKVQTFEAFPKFLDSLSSFTDRMKKEMPVINPDTSFIPSTPSTPAAQRRSVYNQNCPSISTFTSPPSENMASPYFMKKDKYSPKVATGTVDKVGSSPRVTNQGIHLEKDKSPVMHNKTRENTNTDNLVHTVYAPSIPGLPLNTQLLSIMNSAAVPKDKPYCIVLNKGFPTEQMFYVDPAKTGVASSKGSPSAQTPSSSVPTQTLNNMGSAGQPKINIPSQALNSVEITKQPNSNVPTQTLNNVGLAVQPKINTLSQTPNNVEITKQLNSNIPTQMLNNKDGNKQPMKTFAITCAPGQPIMDQLKQILSTPSLPKHEPYYMIFNRGTAQEQTLLIEPNKQGKSDNQGSLSKESPEGSKTVDLVQVPGDMVVKKDEKIAGTPVPKILEEPHSDIPTPVLEESNKFLKFCKLTNPSTNKIPVAAVTPQPKQQVLGKNLDNPAESTVSPVLFEPSFEETTQQGTDKNHIVDNSSKSKDDTTAAHLREPLFKRKPIFKKEVNSSSNVNYELRAEDKTTSTGECIVKEENETKINVNRGKDKTSVTDERISKDVKSSDTISKTSQEDSPSCKKNRIPEKQESSAKKRTSRGKFDRSIIEKLKTNRRKTIESKDHVTETSSSINEKESLHDITNTATVSQNQNPLETDSQSDEEFLCTRRKSGRKRLSNGKNKQSLKRQKGVQYVEEIESNQENMNVVSDSLTCAKCGNAILKMKDTLSRKECPEFLQKLCGQKETKVFTGTIPDIKETSVKVLTTISDEGCMLDSLYVSADKCCVQYLQCDRCPNRDHSAIGARILMTEKQSQFTVGQAWIISSAVKT